MDKLIVNFDILMWARSVVPNMLCIVTMVKLYNTFHPSMNSMNIVHL